MSSHALLRMARTELHAMQAHKLALDGKPMDRLLTDRMLEAETGPAWRVGISTPRVDARKL